MPHTFLHVCRRRGRRELVRANVKPYILTDVKTFEGTRTLISASWQRKKQCPFFYYCYVATCRQQRRYESDDIVLLSNSSHGNIATRWVPQSNELSAISASCYFDVSGELVTESTGRRWNTDRLLAFEKFYAESSLFLTRL